MLGMREKKGQSGTREFAGPLVPLSRHSRGAHTPGTFGGVRALLFALMTLVTTAGVACGGSDFAITPLAMPTTTPSPEPAPTRTLRPAPTPSRTPAPLAFFVANTGGDGAVLRAAPGKGDRVTSLTEGVRVVPQGEEQDVDGRHWLRVQDPDGKTGWVAQELLVATPLPTKTPALPRTPPRR